MNVPVYAVNGVVSWKKTRGQEVGIFQQAAAHFRQRRPWVLRILMLPLNSPTVGEFQHRILYLWKKCSDMKRIFRPKKKKNFRQAKM